MSVPAVGLTAVVLLVLVPIWFPLAVIADVVRGRFRVPLARLVSFALCWSWLETIGVLSAVGLWCSGRGRDMDRHYRLERWWAERMLGALRLTIGLEVAADGVEQMRPGPIVVIARHACLADSVVTVALVGVRADLDPRVVLKRELIVDPCLDIVGNRIPNHFVDRGASDNSAELAAISGMMAGADERTAGIIFAEGTRANDEKRARLLARTAERDPERAERLAPLRHLLPPRAAGARAMLDGVPDADVVFLWHAGFEGFDTFGGILRGLAAPLRPVLCGSWRVPRSDVPSGDGFGRWLDEQWLQMDAEVDRALARRAGGAGEEDT